MYDPSDDTIDEPFAWVQQTMPDDEPMPVNTPETSAAPPGQPSEDAVRAWLLQDCGKILGDLPTGTLLYLNGKIHEIHGRMGHVAEVERAIADASDAEG